MKRVLSLLLAFVFFQAQSWALSGGPTYGSANNNVSGTWAGTMIGNVGSNGLGLFQIGVPTAGLGSGVFAFYVGGGAFFGTVVALVDGEKSQMAGVMAGSLKETGYVPTSSSGGTTTLTLSTFDVALMGGQFIAKIKGATAGTTAINVGARLTGTADVTVTGTNSLIVGTPPGLALGDSTLILDGFEQSSQVTGQVSLNTLTGATNAGG